MFLRHLSYPLRGFCISQNHQWKKITGVEKIFIKILGNEIKLSLFLLNDETMKDIWLNKKGVRVNDK